MPVFNKDDKELITQVLESEKKRNVSFIIGYATAIKATFARGVIAEVEPRIEAITKTVERTVRNIRTEVNTGLASVGRGFTILKARILKGKNVRFIYTGPLDSSTRPFCANHVGESYSLAELDKLDNGQGLSVRTSLGGYNCRHYLVPDGSSDN